VFTVSVGFLLNHQGTEIFLFAS